MNVFISGGTGFVGVNLANFLLSRGHHVTVMGQSMQRPPGLDPSVEVIGGDARQPGSWQDHVARSPLIVNLAGASIFSRWTAERKRLIRESRILTTRNIVEALPSPADGVTLLSTSAVGYYGFRGDEPLTEDALPGDDFLARLCCDWEEEARGAGRKGATVCITRFGIVLGRHGGTLGKMIPLFRFGLGGPIGTGQQWFSWVHMEDLLSALFFLVEQPGSGGAYNVTSPHPVRNRDLALSLGRAMRRPAILPAPSFMVRLAMGELGSVVLKGQRVVPARLNERGYRFQHPRIDEALRDVAG